MYNSEKQPARLQENNYENNSEFKEKLKELLEYLNIMSEDLNKQGIPVDKDCRINIDSFSSIYSAGKIKKNKEYVKKLERIFILESLSNNGKNKILKDKIEFKGEEMEMLKTAIFHKNLSPDYIVVRTSKYDDYANNVDNIILNRKTGSVICAFDDIAPIGEYYYKEKKRKTLNRNKANNGATIKYGISVDKEKIVLSRMNNIPIFYLALGPDMLKKGIEEFGDNKQEKKLFEILISEIELQIKKIEYEFKNLDPELKKHFDDFKKFIESIYHKKIIYNNGTNEKP